MNCFEKWNSQQAPIPFFKIIKTNTIIKSPLKMNDMDNFFKDTQGILQSHFAIATFDSPNTSICSLLVALISHYFTPFHSVKHHINWKVI